MTTTESALLIILSSALAVFLILGIVVLTKLVQVLNHIKHITEKAEKIADQAEHVSEFFQNTAGSAALAKLVSNIVHAIKSRHDKEGK